MEEHEVKTVIVKEHTLFKDQEVEYEAMYEYCEYADEFITAEDMIRENDIAMKDAYRRRMGLLTSEEIIAIRKKYGVSQVDLARFLGWGEKTITRYEGHQVQDFAHDSILRKLDSDPQWYLDMVRANRKETSLTIYKKYYELIVDLVEKQADNYLKQAITAKYVKLSGNEELCGNATLNLEKVVAVVNYYASSKNVTSLFKVKLMKLLWYADALFYKRFGHAMTGLVYQALPMGAVPVAHESLIQLSGICYEEIEFEEGTGYKFIENTEWTDEILTREEKAVLDTVISVCGKDSKAQIVNRMHMERAYTETKRGEMIGFSHAKALSIS
ncbi:MAG: DUF4065 domain-containing protein [Lachnospiraceae bacterium]|nr:DUF4065 domain-containing protein [Lachnospiraceae bacterium]